MTTQFATDPGSSKGISTRSGRLLRRTALVAALAAAGLASTNASAVLTDVCTTATTTISGSNTGAADQYCVLGTGESLVVNTAITFNASTVSGDIDAVVVQGQSAGSVDNSGTITSSLGRSMLIVTNSTLGGGINNRTGATIDGAEGIVVSNGSALQNGILNNGTIKTHGPSDCEAITVLATGQITGRIINRGSIQGCNNGAGTAIFNVGTIDGLDNLQGGGGSPLQYSGILPAAYRIIIGSTASFGSMQATAPTGTMTFDIDPSSTLQVHTYPDVLVGVPPANVTGPLSGTFGAFHWQLILANGSGVWDLEVTTLAPAGPATPVPALPAWGGAVLAALLGAFGALGLRRRRRN